MAALLKNNKALASFSCIQEQKTRAWLMASGAVGQSRSSI
jgi:hypothetical protein